MRKVIFEYILGGLFMAAMGAGLAYIFIYRAAWY